MSEFNVGDKYYLAGRDLCIWTMTGTVKHDNGMTSCYEFESKKHGTTTVLKSAIHNAAFPATYENYDKLSEVWPNLEKPPKCAREDRDVTDPKPFTIHEYHESCRDKLPCLCWAADDASATPVLTFIKEYREFSYHDALHEWQYAIPLSDGELEQLTTLNKEANDG